ncbi:hypothetical protein CVT24_008930, partial [Panaeolus cyanescens]
GEAVLDLLSPGGHIIDERRQPYRFLFTTPHPSTMSSGQLQNRTFDDRDSHLIYQGHWNLQGTWDAPGIGHGTISSTSYETQPANVTFTFPEPAVAFFFYGLQTEMGGMYGICVDCDPNNPNWESIDAFNPDAFGQSPPLSCSAQDHHSKRTGYKNQLRAEWLIYTRRRPLRYPDRKAGCHYPMISPTSNSVLEPTTAANATSTSASLNMITVSGHGSTQTPASTTTTAASKTTTLVTIESSDISSPTTTSSSRNKIAIGPIVGGLLGGLASLCLLIYLVYRRYKRTERSKSERAQTTVHHYCGTQNAPPAISMPAPIIANSNSTKAAEMRGTAASPAPTRQLPTSTSHGGRQMQAMVRRERDGGPLQFVNEEDSEDGNGLSGVVPVTVLPPAYREVFRH